MMTVYKILKIIGITTLFLIFNILFLAIMVLLAYGVSQITPLLVSVILLMFLLVSAIWATIYIWTIFKLTLEDEV